MKKEKVQLKPEGTVYTYERTGRCQPEKCGAFCCRQGAWMLTVRDKDSKKFFELHGVRSIGKINNDDVMSPCTNCSALKGLKCGIYNHRPKICKDFPVAREQGYYQIAVQHGCTFRFKKVKVKSCTNKRSR